jgi:hypothetical protein
MREVYYGLTNGKSWTSKLIEFWTRSNRSHAFFVNPEIFDGTKNSLYRLGSIIEAWNKPNESIFKTRVINSCIKYHSPGTLFTIYKLNVDDEAYQKILEFQKVCAYLEIPYDWKAIIAFVLPMKLKRNGYLFCSEKECLSLKYAGILPNEIECWKVSPDRFEALLLTLGAKKVLEFTS